MFVTYAAHHEKEWQVATEQRERLEETVESLARQHISLEKAMTKSKRNLSDLTSGEWEKVWFVSKTM